MKKIILIIAASLFSIQAFSVQKILDTNLSEFAVASIENNEAVIRYNPEYCEMQTSQLCEFFISHEHGHIALGHSLGGEYTVVEEYAADCWVIQNTPEDISKSAYVYFSNKGYMDSDAERAKNILNCPKEEIFFSEKQLSTDQLSKRKQTRSRYNHFEADSMFRYYELIYPQYFPISFFEGNYAYEHVSNGLIQYTKTYSNGSELAEYNGFLYYRIPLLIGYYSWTKHEPIYYMAY